MSPSTTVLYLDLISVAGGGGGKEGDKDKGHRWRERGAEKNIG